ncbi:MAG: redoxin domain-containing protein [Planctomycetota bacterium]
MFCRMLGLLLCVGLLVQSAVGEDRASPLKSGDKAPDFELPVQGSDEYVRLSTLLQDGPVVVVVLRGYPGYQCSLCTQQYGSLINRARSLAKATGDTPRRVVLIYPGDDSSLESRARQFMGSRKLPDPFVVVRDPGMEMVRQWGLRWNRSRETAYPATYVIGRGQRVKWAKVSRSHAGRATVQEILEALDDLS